jgi:hypothetical protein
VCNPHRNFVASPPPPRPHPRPCVQTGLETLFENMGFQTLKDIRRFLPISGKKMEWVLAAHRMTRTLRK